MTKKDWGDTAYCVSYRNYINGHYVHPAVANISEHKITKLGSKYLYTEESWTRYEIETGREDKDYGDRDTVFPTMQAAEEYVKRNHLLNTLAKYLSSVGVVVVRNLSVEKMEELLEYFDQGESE